MWLRTRMQEVIPMKKSKPYSALPVNRVSLEVLIRGRVGQDVVVGFDIGKFEILTVPPSRATTTSTALGRVSNPEQIPDLVRLLVQLGHGRALACGPGAIGHLRRSAARQASATTRRPCPYGVSAPRRPAMTYAEIFDGTPSQHDGQQERAGVVAELAGAGPRRQRRGPYLTVKPVWEQQPGLLGRLAGARSGNCWCCGRVAWRDLLGAVLAGSNAGAGR